MLVQSLKTCECISIIKDRLFSKHTVQSDSWKTMGNLCFSTNSALWLFCYYSWWHKVLIAEQKNVRTNVRCYRSFSAKKWCKSFFALPSTHNSAQLHEKSVKYPSPVTARNPDEQKFVQPSSSKKMWSAYVSLHKVFPFHLKIRCTVEFQAPFFPGKVIMTKLWKRGDFFEPRLLLRPGMKIETVDVSWNFTIPPLEF